MYKRGDRITCRYGMNDNTTGIVITDDPAEAGVWFIRDTDNHKWQNGTSVIEHQHVIPVRFVDYTAITHKE